ncbi:MAG: hypothetical protein FJW34_04385 [Acidobacteria bacterium]|nr:hypothetical protein [Acidobacteriota bacterium]
MLALLLVLAAASWWNPAFERRLPIQVDAAGFERSDRPVEVDLKLPREAQSLRLVEADSKGNVVDAAVPFQFDPPATLVLLLKGPTPPAATRRFHLYFNTSRARVPQASPPPALALEDDVPYEGQPSYRITTPGGVYLYHKEGGGFAGLKDREGTEWIGYRPGGRSAGEFRGIPNLGVWGHPGYSGERGCASRILGQGPLRTSILSERGDGQAALRWDIFPGHARMTLLRAAEPYWFLYEGTPHGKLDLEHGYLALSNGERRPLATAWAEPLPAPEWLYFANEKSRRVLYLVNHQNDAALDQYWPMEGNMTVFGFGRQYRCCGRYMTAAPAVFTLGFVEQSAFAQVERALNSATRDLRVILGAVESPSP